MTEIQMTNGSVVIAWGWIIHESCNTMSYNTTFLLHICRGTLSVAVDWCIWYTRKMHHGSDWERSRPHGQRNVHNFSMTVRPTSYACGHATEMLLILKKYFRPDYCPIFWDMTVHRNVPRFCTRSICDLNLFQPPGLIWVLYFEKIQNFFCFPIS